MSKQKLELTWIGKDERPKLEPRVLVDDPYKSYHAKHKVKDNDIFDNRLIFGDNLLALKALEQEFTGKIKCIYIDPPFNTGAAFEHYDDGLEHSKWLSLIRDRLDILYKLLREDGAFIVHIDDNEQAYLKVILDEKFGRGNFLNNIVIRDSHPSGLKLSSKDQTIVKTKSYMMVYRKSDALRLNPIYQSRNDWDMHFSIFIENEIKYSLRDKLLREHIMSDKESINSSSLSNAKFRKFCFDNRDKIYQSTKELPQFAKDESLQNPGRVYRYVTNDGDINYAFNGRRLSQLTKSIQNVGIDGEFKEDFAKLLCDFWDDVDFNNTQSEGGVQFPQSKKPEYLIARILTMFSVKGDYVLDSFAGSGTTGAVAHKMGRKWIMVELGEHCHTHIIPRMQQVIDGTDQGGISKSVNWKGGGGFRYYKLAPSLLEKDKWGNWVINQEYNKELLAEAICKLEGFTYAPSDTVFWQHGYSTESDFIYVTTQTLTIEQLRLISEEVGTEKSLLILCSAFKGDTTQFENLTVKKIPKHVLNKCEYGKDDYSLNVKNLPMSDKEEKQGTLFDSGEFI
jgi:adenine-specific DNA-methyltransferase